MTTHRWRWATPRLAVAVALVLAGCSSAPSTSSSAAPSASPTASATATTVTISAVDSSFGPDITVATGTKVVFVNNGALKHTASHGKDGQLAEGSLFDFTLEPGASDSYTFDVPGSYPITCIVHPLMNMTLTVE